MELHQSVVKNSIITVPTLIISKYIKDTTGTPIVISPDDWLCTSCYNTHCSIVKSTECELNGSDEMLIKSIDDWEAKAYDTDQLTKAVLSSVIFVAKYLLLQKALLLPWVCQVFLIAYGIQYTGDIKSVQVTLEVGDSSVKFSSRWLLHQLITHLDGYMMHKCIHMKFGIVLYRRGEIFLLHCLGHSAHHNPQISISPNLKSSAKIQISIKH